MSGITIQSSNRRPFSDAFKAYADWNHRDAAELFVDQTRKLATELYTQTALIAPTEAEIASDVKAHGWHIPKRFADGRTGRGSARAWVANAWAMALKSKAIKKKRGRGAGAHNQAVENEFRAANARPTLEQMQAYVIALRSRASKFLASGWLGAIADLGGMLPSAGAKRGALQGSSGVTRQRGGADIHKSRTGVEVTCWNQSPGIEDVDSQKHFVEKAIAVRALDMWTYTRRKMAEAARRYFPKAA